MGADLRPERSVLRKGITVQSPLQSIVFVGGVCRGPQCLSLTNTYRPRKVLHCVRLGAEAHRLWPCGPRGSSPRALIGFLLAAGTLESLSASTSKLVCHSVVKRRGASWTERPVATQFGPRTPFQELQRDRHRLRPTSGHYCSPEAVEAWGRRVPSVVIGCLQSQQIGW